MTTVPGLDGDRIEPLQPIALHRRRLRVVSPPIPLTPLVGRASAVTTVAGVLADGDTRLVTLVGPGGIGKTRLALEVAAACSAAFNGRVAWAPVATATTAQAVAAALAGAVGVADAGATPTLEALKGAVQGFRLLLVIDNFEQAIDGAPILSDLLRSCAGLSILVTSRALLRVEGEHPVEVPPLATEGDAAEMSPAIQLFGQHAASVDPAFTLTDENAPVIAEICRRLDGLPLAIELAAARTRLLPPRELLARLDRRLPYLTTGQRDAPERHRTMRDAIAWSYDLLSPDEQRVFRCLGTFAGGCSTEGAEAVCAQPGGDGDVLEILESLTAQSLLRVDPGTSGDGQPRLTMLETIREFAVEQLAATGDDTPGRRHAEYFAGLSAQVEEGILRGDYARWTAVIAPERANLGVALGWALEHSDADAALRLAISMYSPIWISDAYAQESDRALKRALDLPGGLPAARVAALVIAAWVSPAQFDRAEAEALGQAWLAAARRAGDDLDAANAAAALGVIKLHAGDDDSARRFLTEALTGFRRVGASTGAGWALCDLAALDSRDAVDEGGDPGALARARAHYDEAVALFRAIDHPRGIARSLHGLAYVTYKQRDLAQALANTQEILALAWANRWPVFSYLEDIADIAGRIGHAETAARLYGAADAQRERFGLPIEPQYREEYERDVAVARRALGEAAFTAARAAGYDLSPEQAVAEALAVAARSTAAAAPSPLLSPREQEVLRLLANGLSDRDIADALFIGERTVNTHVARLYAKLGVRNRATAVSAAIAAGLLDPASLRPGPS